MIKPRPLHLIGVLAAFVLATPAAATPPAPPEPDPRQRQMVVDLAYVLGEAHALHRACSDRENNTWRGRMSRLIQTEAPDQAYRQRLLDSFNAGFVARNAEFPVCTVKTVDAERKVAERGRDLARHISSGVSP